MTRVGLLGLLVGGDDMMNFDDMGMTEPWTLRQPRRASKRTYVRARARIRDGIRSAVESPVPEVLTGATVPR